DRVPRGGGVRGRPGRRAVGGRARGGRARRDGARGRGPPLGGPDVRRPPPADHRSRAAGPHGRGGEEAGRCRVLLRPARRAPPLGTVAHRGRAGLMGRLPDIEGRGLLVADLAGTIALLVVTLLLAVSDADA